MHNDVNDHENVVVSYDDNLIQREIIAHEVEMLNSRVSNSSKKESSHELENSHMPQLEVKADDLILAAKLGKALLEKNQILTSENFRISRKLEVR